MPTSNSTNIQFVPSPPAAEEKPFEVNPMIELTGEQLARLAALVNAGELIRGGGLMRGNPAQIGDIIDLAEYIITGDTIIRTQHKSRELYSRIRVDETSDTVDRASVVVNRDSEAAAA
jgi:hypothetical protein